MQLYVALKCSQNLTPNCYLQTCVSHIDNFRAGVWLFKLLYGLETDQEAHIHMRLRRLAEELEKEPGPIAKGLHDFQVMLTKMEREHSERMVSFAVEIGFWGIACYTNGQLICDHKKNACPPSAMHAMQLKTRNRVP